MKMALCSSYKNRSYSLFIVRLLTATAWLVFIAGCGSGMVPAPAPTPGPTGTTIVAVQTGSTSNGKFSAFPITLNSITLTSSSGKTVNLLDSPQMAEFSHLNGGTALLATATIPQGTYTAATVMYSNPAFTYITIGSTGGLFFNTDSNLLGIQSATVKLPSPINISGSAMGLLLDLQVSQSASCSCQGTPDTYAITPTFTVNSISVSSSPTSFRNGKLAGMHGRVVSVNTNANSVSLAVNNGWSFSTLANGPTLTVNVNAGTVYQRLGGIASLTTGEFVDMDAAIQMDGSLLATRVELQDPTALNVMIGPVAFISPLAPEFIDFGRQQQGDDLSINPINFETYSYNRSAVFQISGEFSSPASLPFTALFDASNMVSGQNVAVSFIFKSHFGGTFTTADTITLMPQTINGTVSAVSTSGAFTIYRVSLPAYDAIPTLNGATNVFAYVDASTQTFASSPIRVGSVVRLSGFLFSDSGTLRLVAEQVNDGVAQ